MAKSNLILPLRLLNNDTFILCDGSWCLLFEQFFIRYSLQVQRPHDVVKVKVISAAKNRYGLRLMEVTPDEGKVVVPVSNDAVQYHDLYRIHLAMALSYIKRKKKSKEQCSAKNSKNS